MEIINLKIAICIASESDLYGEIEDESVVILLNNNPIGTFHPEGKVFAFDDALKIWKYFLTDNQLTEIDQKCSDLWNKHFKQ